MSGTEADTAGEEALTPQQEEFLQTLLTFRDGLPAQQRDAFDAIVRAAGAQTADEGDTQGFFFGVGPALLASHYARRVSVKPPERETQNLEQIRRNVAGYGAG